MNPFRLPIHRLMFWVAVVAVNLAVFRGLFTTRRFDILLGGVLTWAALQFGASRAARSFGRGRSFWLGFSAGGAAAAALMIAARTFHVPIVTGAWKGYFLSATNPVYDPHVLNALERSIGGDFGELVLVLYETAVQFLPLLLSALAAGLLARRFQDRSGRSPGPEAMPFTSARPTSSPSAP